MNRRAIAALALAAMVAAAAPAWAQSCPPLLREARRLAPVTADGMTATAASMQLFARALPGAAWRSLGPAEPALIGKSGMASLGLSRLGARGRTDEGRRRQARARRDLSHGRELRLFRLAPAGLPARDRGNGVRRRSRLAAYNTITTCAAVGWKVHGENMWRVSAYRRGLLVDYPTDAAARAGSCIFIHVRLASATGTAGCVALPEPRVMALQDFARPGAVLAILPAQVLDRLAGCLPAFERN